jgi:hypothetical protein
MCAAKSVPMETDSAMVKKHGRFAGRPVRRIMLQFVERYSREALLSGLARKLVGCQPRMQRLTRHPDLLRYLRYRQTVTDHGQHGLIPLLGHA